MGFSILADQMPTFDFSRDAVTIMATGPYRDGGVSAVICVVTIEYLAGLTRRGALHGDDAVSAYLGNRAVIEARLAEKFERHGPDHQGHLILTSSDQ